MIAYSAYKAFRGMAHVVYPALVCDGCVVSNQASYITRQGKCRKLTRRSNTSVEAEEKSADCCKQRYTKGIP
jgi:hypothetical protein